MPRSFERQVLDETCPLCLQPLAYVSVCSEDDFADDVVCETDACPYVRCRTCGAMEVNIRGCFWCPECAPDEVARSTEIDGAVLTPMGTARFVGLARELVGYDHGPIAKELFAEVGRLRAEVGRLRLRAPGDDIRDGMSDADRAAWDAATDVGRVELLGRVVARQIGGAR